jgi:hypothetical protein
MPHPIRSAVRALALCVLLVGAPGATLADVLGGQVSVPVKNGSMTLLVTVDTSTNLVQF